MPNLYLCFIIRFVQYQKHIFNDPIIYISLAGQFKLGTQAQADNEGWKSIKSYIQQHGQQAVINKTIFNQDDILNFSGEPNVWDQFEKKIANFFPLLYADHIFKKYIKHICLKFAANGYDRAQFRALITNLTEYDAQGKIVKVHPETRYMEHIDSVMVQVKQLYPNYEIGIIYNALKMFPRQKNVQYFEQILKLKWKRGVGVDFVNSQDSFGSLGEYDDILEGVFAKNPDYCLPKVYHAGQTNDHRNRNVEIAIKAGAVRIGHGINILQNLDLISKSRDVCFQLNPVSNIVLNYVSDPRKSPAPLMFYLGLPLTINPDDPGKFGYQNSTLDFFVAATCFNWSLYEIKVTLEHSIEYALCSEQQKQQLRKNFSEKWQQWLKKIPSIIHHQQA